MSKEMIIAAPLTAREQHIPHRHAEKLTYAARGAVFAKYAKHSGSRINTGLNELKGGSLVLTVANVGTQMQHSCLSHLNPHNGTIIIAYLKM